MVFFDEDPLKTNEYEIPEPPPLGEKCAADCGVLIREIYESSWRLHILRLQWRILEGEATVLGRKVQVADERLKALYGMLSSLPPEDIWLNPLILDFEVKLKTVREAVERAFGRKAKEAAPATTNPPDV